MGVLMAGGVATLLNGWWEPEELAQAIDDVRLSVRDKPIEAIGGISFDSSGFGIAPELTPAKVMVICPASVSVTSRLVRISICRTFLIISRVWSEVIYKASWRGWTARGDQGTGRPSRMPATMFSEVMFSASAS